MRSAAVLWAEEPSRDPELPMFPDMLVSSEANARGRIRRLTYLAVAVSPFPSDVMLGAVGCY